MSLPDRSLDVLTISIAESIHIGFDTCYALEFVDDRRFQERLVVARHLWRRDTNCLRTREHRGELVASNRPMVGRGNVFKSVKQRLKEPRPIRVRWEISIGHPNEIEMVVVSTERFTRTSHLHYPL